MSQPRHPERGDVPRAVPPPTRPVEAERTTDPVRQEGHGTDRLISISDIRTLFKLGRTAAYELTHRAGFPAPVQVSRRCLRWRASEVDAYISTLQHQAAQRRVRRTTPRQTASFAAQSRRITGQVRAVRGRNEQT